MIINCIITALNFLLKEKKLNAVSIVLKEQEVQDISQFLSAHLSQTF
jgi:hypothetical protein